ASVEEHSRSGCRLGEKEDERQGVRPGRESGGHHARRCGAGNARGRCHRRGNQSAASRCGSAGTGRAAASMSNRVTTREFVMSDYDDVIALWEGVDGVDICEGDSRAEIAEYLQRNPGLSQVA